MSTAGAPTARPVDDVDHSSGPDSAPVTLIMYGEFECPHCGRAYFVVKQLKEILGDNLRFVFRHFAREEVHPFSERAAEAAEAAGAQGKFWAMHDRLFENQHALEYRDLQVHAEAVGLDAERFWADMRAHKHLEMVRGHLDEGRRSGVKETPTFFINGERYEGPLEREALFAALARAALAVVP